ncbi:MAG: endonuclease/exonuclease/phosphatase family protein [Candidatus Thiodiazotropha taylori]|nr:endonuclease/exonuclease/phosphatase family protein [Candidatus Thiodiazotropha taylori]
MNKLDLLHAELFEVDILAFTETWLNPGTPDDELFLQSYNKPERKDRTDDSHGGVMIYVKEAIHYKRRYDLEIRDTENIWIELAINRKKILFGLFYRPPNSDAQHYYRIEDSLALATDTGISNIIVTGDFNYNFLNSRTKRKIDSFCTQFSLHQVIYQPTHFTEHSSSLIDIILVNNKEQLILSGVGEPFLSQDTRYHCPVFGILKFAKPKSKVFEREIWNYNNGNYDLLREKAALVDWESLHDNNIDTYACNIQPTILSLAKECKESALAQCNSKT